MRRVLFLRLLVVFVLTGCVRVIRVVSPGDVFRCQEYCSHMHANSPLYPEEPGGAECYWGEIDSKTGEATFYCKPYDA